MVTADLLQRTGELVTDANGQRMFRLPRSECAACVLRCASRVTPELELDGPEPIAVDAPDGIAHLAWGRRALNEVHLTLYGLPLAAVILATLAATSAGLGDGLAALAGGIGCFGGMKLAVRRLSTSRTSLLAALRVAMDASAQGPAVTNACQSGYRAREQGGG